MKAETLKIASLFGDTPQGSYNETLRQLECSYVFSLARMPENNALLDSLPKISDRDSWRMRLLTENGDDVFDLRKGCDIGADYSLDKLKPYEGDTLRLVYTVDKNKVNTVLSVYDKSLLQKYLQELTVPQFLSLLKTNLGDDGLVLEIWSADFERFSSNSLAVFGKGDCIPQFSVDEKIKKRIFDCGQYCQWNYKLASVLPEDVHIIDGDVSGALACLFNQVCLLLSVCYVADFSSVGQDGIKFRMSGFKTMVVEKQSVKMKDLAFDKNSVSQWYKIYDWCYTGGYTSDRLTIARNIISLNCTDYTTLQLNASTLETIKSNFRIFEQDNVRQYIKVRKDVSNDLLDLQDRINSVVEGFTGDFRKNVVGLGTFFLTLVVVRVVANGQWAGAFSNQILVLSVIFIVLSAVLLIYSRLTLEKKEKLYTKHYDQLYERYKLLLSEEEAKKIFEECNPQKVGTHADYIRWQKKIYTWIWSMTLGVFLLFIVFAWCYNLFETTNIYKILKAIITCCTKSI